MQVGHIAVSGDNAVRYFYGIEGDKSNRGELFGMRNIFQDITRSRGGRCLTEDILRRNKEIENNLKDKGYAVDTYVHGKDKDEEDRESDDVSIDDYSEEGGVESDSDEPLASTSQGSRKRSQRSRVRQSDDEDSEPQVKWKRRDKSKSRVTFQDPSSVEVESHGDTDTVSGVLARCGVTHTHRNFSVTGGSRGEDHMSRRAMEDVYERHQNTQAPALDCDPFSESESEDEEAVLALEKRISETKARGKAVKTTPTMSLVMDGRRVLFGQTPASMRSRQFDKLVSQLGCRDKTELAKKVLYSTAEERNCWLKDMYELECFPPEGDSDTSLVFPAKGRGGKDVGRKGSRNPQPSTSATRKPHTPSPSPHKTRPRATEIVYEDCTDSDMASYGRGSLETSGGPTRKARKKFSKTADFNKSATKAPPPKKSKLTKSKSPAKSLPSRNAGEQEAQSADILEFLDDMYHSPAPRTAMKPPVSTTKPSPIKASTSARSQSVQDHDIEDSLANLDATFFGI